MILTAKKGTDFEQALKALHEQYVRNAKEATEVLTEYYGVRPETLRTSWLLGYTSIIWAVDIKPEYIPETLKKGVKVTDNGLLTVNLRTKVGREFFAHWNTLDCAKGLSGKSLEPFGIYTLDPDTCKYGNWRVYTTDDGLYRIVLHEYAARRLTKVAKTMMTIDL